MRNNKYLQVRQVPKLMPLCLIFSFVFGQDKVDDWLSRNIALIDTSGIQISFVYQITTQFENSIENGEIIWEDDKFKFQLGPKIIASDGVIWRTYDSRTNQLFIHDPDTLFEQTVLKWFKPENLSQIKHFAGDSDSEFILTFPDDIPDLNLSFEENSDSIKSIIMTGDSYYQTVTDISITPFKSDSSDYFVIEFPDAFEIDLRE